VVRDTHKIGVFEEKKKGRSDKISHLPFSLPQDFSAIISRFP